MIAVSIFRALCISCMIISLNAEPNQASTSPLLVSTSTITTTDALTTPYSLTTASEVSKTNLSVYGVQQNRTPTSPLFYHNGMGDYGDTAQKCQCTITIEVRSNKEGVQQLRGDVQRLECLCGHLVHGDHKGLECRLTTTPLGFKHFNWFWSQMARGPFLSSTTSESIRVPVIRTSSTSMANKVRLSSRAGLPQPIVTSPVDGFAEWTVPTQRKDQPFLVIYFQGRTFNNLFAKSSCSLLYKLAKMRTREPPRNQLIRIR
jgi:hypothetical protein